MFFFLKYENVNYIIVKLIYNYKLVNYVNLELQNLILLAFLLSSLGL